MRIIPRIVEYNLRYFVLAVGIFMLFWHLLSIRGAATMGEDKLLTALSQKSVDLEAAFISNDAIEFQKTMWQLKNNNVKEIKFTPEISEQGEWKFKEVIVGELIDDENWIIHKTVPVVSNGAALGRIEYFIDLLEISSAVFRQNYVLFITIGIFFLGLLTISSLGAVKTILSLERCVTETNHLVDLGDYSRIRQAIQDNINSLPSSLRGTPFSVLISSLAEVLQRAAHLESELAVSKATADLAAQVAHDIRSPLSALGAAAKGLEMPEDQRKLVEGAVGRMQGIADDLLQRYRAPSAGQAAAKTAVYALGGLIEQVLSEKRLQHKGKTGVKIEFNGAPGEIKAMVEPKELQRLLSNLVNNSVEAFAGPGKIDVSLSALDGKVLIEVKDNGKGIPPEIITKLGQKGETHGKAGGNGLGLYHARTTVEGWGGNFKIESEQGKGTSVYISLPRAGTPAGKMAILLDDDMLVHMNWKLAAKAAGVELKAYKTPEELSAGAKNLHKDTPVYIDSDLGNNIRGEDIAIELRDKGFTYITMATGHGPEKFAHLPWLKVTGKEPPWA